MNEYFSMISYCPRQSWSFSAVARVWDGMWNLAMLKPRPATDVARAEQLSIAHVLLHFVAASVVVVVVITPPPSHRKSHCLHIHVLVLLNIL